MSLIWLHTWEEPGKVVLLCATNSQSLEEKFLFCTETLGNWPWATGLQVPWGSQGKLQIFLDRELLLFRKTQWIFWWVTDASIVENSPDKPLCWPEMTRPWHQVSVFIIYRIVLKSVHRGCHKKTFRICIFPPKSTSICHLVENPLPFCYVLRFLSFNFVNFLIHRKKSPMNF